ncbi:MAG: hypothetical protein Tsb0021_13020 [Chlamydiales bacterium]
MESLQELYHRLSKLETEQDYLITELQYLNELLQRIGFERGLETVKAVAEQIVSEQTKTNK